MTCPKKDEGRRLGIGGTSGMSQAQAALTLGRITTPRTFRKVAAYCAGPDQASAPRSVRTVGAGHVCASSREAGNECTRPLAGMARSLKPRFG